MATSAARNPAASQRAKFDQILEEVKPSLEVLGALYQHAITAGIPAALAEAIVRDVAVSAGIVSGE